jgi:hypothetical protein
MKTKRLKTITGYTALSRQLTKLGVRDHALDDDVLIEVNKAKIDFPYEPYTYTGGVVGFWKGSDNRYFAWPEVKHKTYAIYELIRD